jgi:membrane fusion protein, multidrug efflux system
MRKGASFAPLRRTGAALLSGGLLSGCGGDDGPSQAPLARVDVVTAKVVDFAPRVTLTGTIQAQVQNDLSFRLSGKIIERSVDVGDHVMADQILARLDPRTQEADVESATAGVQSAEAQLKQATATYQRSEWSSDRAGRRRVPLRSRPAHRRAPPLHTRQTGASDGSAR